MSLGKPRAGAFGGVAYASDDDVFTLGLSAQAFVGRSRPVPAADVAGGTGVIRLKAHGLTAEDVVTFEVTSGGTLPTAITAFTPYTPVPLSFDLLRVAPVGGATITGFASVGSGWGIAVDPLRRIRAHADEASAAIDKVLKAHAVPIQPDPTTGEYPMFLRGLCARMAARAAVTSLQIENAQYRVAVDRLFAREEWDRITLSEWRGGEPLHPTPTDLSPGVADNGARVASAVPAADWQGRI